MGVPESVDRPPPLTHPASERTELNTAERRANVPCGQDVAVVAPHRQHGEQRGACDVRRDTLTEHGVEDMHVLDRATRDRGQVEVAPRTLVMLTPGEDSS